MSAILLANPFAPPPQPVGTPTEAASPAAVTPLQSSAETSTSGTADSYAGSGTGGSGTSKQGDSVALFQSRKATPVSRPPDATAGSVIGAQAEDNPFGTNLPEVEMPLPLPTSPFLIRDDGPDPQK